MNEPSPIALKGVSGRVYTFFVYPGGTSFKAAGGVYAVTRSMPNQSGGDTHSVVYIGQTGDLSERFDDHHKAECCRRHGANSICVMLQQDEQARLAIERDLVASYGPPCNG